MHVTGTFTDQFNDTIDVDVEIDDDIVTGLVEAEDEYELDCTEQTYCLDKSLPEWLAITTLAEHIRRGEYIVLPMVLSDPDYTPSTHQKDLMLTYSMDKINTHEIDYV